MPERSYADVVGRFRQGYAGQRASAGDYDGAARAVRDPELQQSYAQMGERQRTRDREETMRGASESYASALASGDYSGAATVAGKVGDAEGVSGARNAQAEVSEQQRIEAWRTLREYRDRVGAIAESEDPQTGYAALLTEAREQSANSPDMQSFLGRLPPEWNPGVQRMLDGTLQTWMERLLTPQQLAEMDQGGEWRGGSGFTNAYRINPDGSVATGGALPLRPHAGRAGDQSEDEAERAARELGVTWD